MKPKDQPVVKEESVKMSTNDWISMFNGGRAADMEKELKEKKDKEDAELRKEKEEQDAIEKKK